MLFFTFIEFSIFPIFANTFIEEAEAKRIEEEQARLAQEWAEYAVKMRERGQFLMNKRYVLFWSVLFFFFHVVVDSFYFFF